MEIKHSNWFAAGPEVQRALLLVSDGAFRLYFHLCLNASRKSGVISMSYSDIAHALGRSRRSITSDFEVLRRQGICLVHPAVNQHQCTKIEICDEFWPYIKVSIAVQPLPGEQYLTQIKSYLSERACIRCTFNPADEKFATDLLARDVSLQQIERAITLGCCRKYVSLLNGIDRGPILSLAYFRELIEEAGGTEIPPGYWSYLMLEIAYLENKWLAAQAKVADAKVASAAKSKETRR
jgi:hypothetical protein